MNEPRKRPASRILHAIMNTPWAITEESLRTIIEIASRENPSPEVIEARLGRPLDNTRTVTVRDGVATIPIMGPLFRHGDMFTRISGASSYDAIATDFTEAIENPDVRAVILELDSPGGEAIGLAELAGMMFDARGRKPIVAYVDGLAASAAYWIASAAGRVVASETAILGSIGAVITVRVTKERDEKAGVRTVDIVSTQSPRKRLDPMSDEGRSQLQAIVDHLGQVFVEAVAKHRGVTVDTVLSDFGKGGIMTAPAAVQAGLADSIGTYEALHAELVERSRRGSGTIHITHEGTRTMDKPQPNAASGASAQPTPTPTAAPATQPPTTQPTAQPAATPAAEEMTREQLAARYPAHVQAFRQEGADAEHARIAGIEALALPGHEKLITDCKADRGCTPPMAAQRIVEAERAKRNAQLSARAADDVTAPMPAATPTTTDTNAEDAMARQILNAGQPKGGRKSE